MARSASTAAPAQEVTEEVDATAALPVAEAGDTFPDPAEPAAEPVADGPDPAVTGEGVTVAMVHPDGGTCDAYETDALDRILVPLKEIGLMIEHGFEVVIDALEDI